MGVCKKCGGSNLNLAGRCRPCWAAYMRVWAAKNPEKKKASNRTTWCRHREKRLAQKKVYNAVHSDRHKVVAREWYLANRERMLALCKEARARRLAADPDGERRKKAEYMARRRRENPQVLIYGRMSALVRQHMKKQRRDAGSKAGRRWEELVGYTVGDLIDHLKKTIPAGYTWDDYLSGELEVDHIAPDKSFRYRSVDDPGFRASWALSNLRLLHRLENSKRRYSS